MSKRYWLSPPDLYARLDNEFHFDFDPCPCPRPPGYNSLVVPWGTANYVNPPFLKLDAPHGGLAAFTKKAIAERDKRACAAGPVEHTSSDGGGEAEVPTRTCMNLAAYVNVVLYDRLQKQFH